MLNERINICIALNDKTGAYCRHIGALIVSILSNTDSAIKIFIITDDTLSRENKSLLEGQIKKFNQDFEFIFITGKWLDMVRSISELKSDYVSIATFYRLLITDLIHVGKIIYLDTDIIVNIDIKELWDVNVDKYSVAAVRDAIATRRLLARHYILYRHFYINNYFNAGVLLLNLDNIRLKHNMFKECYDCLTKSQSYIFFDQDALNYVFKDDCLIISNKFNLLVSEESSKCGKESLKGIIHYAGKYDKPWNGIYSTKDKIYWKYLSQSFWGDHLINYIMEMDTLKYSLERIVPNQCIGSRKQFIYRAINRLFSVIRSFG